MKVHETTVGTTAFYKTRNPKSCWGNVLFFSASELNFQHCTLTDKTRQKVDYYKHKDIARDYSFDGTMLTCIAKDMRNPKGGRSIWIVTDSKSEHFGKYIILNIRPWYNLRYDSAGILRGHPGPTHYNLVENKA